MKWVLILWGGPFAFLTAWYALSYYDMSFGIFLLSREAHDFVFQMYGSVLGIPPETIPPLVARAMILDSLVVFALLAFRRRRKILAWYRRRRASQSSPDAALASTPNLSSAP